MLTTKITHIAHLVEICALKGVKHVVISPGSRNAPLIIGFDSHPDIKTYLIHDERAAAFFAIGMAEELNEPVAITCTSGSAPLNYAPAISEAYYRKIPLLILTADRPTELIDQGDGQTIRQKYLFHNYIKGEFELPNFPDNDELLLSDQVTNKAINTLIESPKGPVHINIPLREPLYETRELKSKPNISKPTVRKSELDKRDLEEIEKVWSSASKKLVLIGQKKIDQSFADAIRILANDPSVAILVENTANIIGFQKICHCIDRTISSISEDEIETFKPDLLVTFGDAIISKKIKEFFRINKPKVNWRVGIHLFEQDTFLSLTRSFGVEEKQFLSHINKIDYLRKSNFGNLWKQRDFIVKDRHDESIQKLPFCDLKVFDFLLDAMPDDTNLQMGNSSVVRYCQLFEPINNVRYYSNRGVSGIDGSTSTAVGMAAASKEKLTLLISGDISFFYDSNGLWNNYLSNNLRIIVINNGGGGIFKFIPGPDKSRQSEIFYAPHQASVKGMCEAYNVNYYKADSMKGLEEVTDHFYSFQENERPAILEIDTSKVSNHALLKDYFQSLGDKN